MSDNPMVAMYLNHYTCPDDGHEWTDEADCMRDDRCPECDAAIRPDWSTPLGDPPLEFRYRNHRGEVAIRRAKPVGFRYASTEHHPERQWIMDAWCVDRGAMRSFAMADMTPLGSMPDEQAKALRAIKARKALASLRVEVAAALEQLDGLGLVWSRDEGVFRRCRDRLRAALGEDAR